MKQVGRMSMYAKCMEGMHARRECMFQYHVMCANNWKNEEEEEKR